MFGNHSSAKHELSSGDSDLDDDVLLKDVLKSSSASTRFCQAETHRKRPLGKSIRSDFISDKSDSDENEAHFLPSPPKARRVESGEQRAAHCDLGDKQLQKLEKLQEREQKKREKERERLRKQEEKLLRQREREEKRKEAERDKQHKRVAMAAKRQAKPGECLKLLHAVISPGVLKLSSGSAILAELQARDVTYDIQAQSHDHMISVWRQVTQVNSEGSTVTSEKVEDNVLLLLELQTFVNLVDAFNTNKKGCGGGLAIEDLESHVVSLQRRLEGRSVTLLVQGIDKHFRNQSVKTKRAFKAQVSGEPEKGRRKQTGSECAVSRLDVEAALVQLQLETGCGVRFVETDQEAAKLVFSFIKAVAEIPFKRDRLVSGFSFHVESGGGVAVGRDGHGLRDAWRQQVQQFKNVTAEVANTILARYPSPTALQQAYSMCSSEKEAQLLLQNLEVRRGAGVMATSRRVGKELSRRVHTLMTSRDPTVVLT